MTKLIRVILEFTVNPEEWLANADGTSIDNCIRSMEELSGPYKINSDALRSFEVLSVEECDDGN